LLAANPPKNQEDHRPAERADSVEQDILDERRPVTGEALVDFVGRRVDKPGGNGKLIRMLLRSTTF
jgi:hypothetical protein